VTFKELRAHLGFESQRQWSDKAIERTTPCLFGLFSLVTLMARVLHPETLPVRETSWYLKEEATFIDALAAVRSDLWRSLNCRTSAQNADMILISQSSLFSLLEAACYSTQMAKVQTESYSENASVYRDLGWDVQQGGDQAPVQLAGVTLVLRLGPEAGDAATLVVGVEGQVQADRIVDAAHKTHAGVGLFVHDLFSDPP